MRRTIPALFITLLCLLPACSDKPVMLDGKLAGQMDGRVDGNVAMRLEGPIMIQMQGPTIRYEGTYISDELLEQVKEDQTTDDWVLAVFGEPTSRADLRDGTQIWRWTYKPTAQEASVIEVFNSSEKEPKLATRTVFVQLRDGMVIRKWRG